VARKFRETGLTIDVFLRDRKVRRVRGGSDALEALKVSFLEDHRAALRYGARLDPSVSIFKIIQIRERTYLAPKERCKGRTSGVARRRDNGQVAPAETEAWDAPGGLRDDPSPIDRRLRLQEEERNPEGNWEHANTRDVVGGRQRVGRLVFRQDTAQS
jgi:hypothetical protein